MILILYYIAVYLILLYHIIHYDINQLLKFALMPQLSYIDLQERIIKEVLSLGIEIDNVMILLIDKAIRMTLAETSNRTVQIISPAAHNG